MSSPLCIISSRPLEVALLAACASYTGEVVEWLSSKEYLSVPAEEVMAELSKLGAPSIVSARSAAMKKVRASKKKSVTAEIPQVKTKPEMLLPFCGVVEPTWCKGIRFNHGLHTQCMKAPTNGEYCGTCFKSAKNSASGKPTYGNINDRLSVELLEFRDPKGKKTSCYANVAEKLGLDIEKAKAEAEKFGWTIPENQLNVQAVKRGRPASKIKVVKAKGKRGRPAKKTAESKSSEMSMDAQIAQLVAEAAEDVMEAENMTLKKKVVRKTAEEKAAEKAAKKAAKEAEKADKKAAKEAEKTAKKAAKEAEKTAKKAAKEAEKAAKKAAKEAEKADKKAAKEAEKAAEKAAKKAAKEAEKAAKKAAKEAEKAAEKAAKKAAKEAEKAAKKAAKEAEKAAKKAVEVSKTDVKKIQLQNEAAEIGLEIVDAQLKNLKIGEIRELIKSHKRAAKDAKKAVKVAKKAAKVAQEAEKKSELVLDGEASIASVTSFDPKSTEEEVDDAMAELDAEMVVDSSDEEDDELSIDPDTTPTVSIDNVEYYRVTYSGQKNVLISMEGELVGVYDEANNEILDVELEE